MEKSSPTKIYGVLGYPAQHSLSPLMHNAAFRALKINANYKIFEKRLEELEKFLLEDVFNEDISGFNITIPHKIKAKEILGKKFPFSLDKITEEDRYYVKLSGAVNTVKKENGQLSYLNTDPRGFLKSLEEKKEDGGLGFVPEGKSALVIGSGGAGRAVVAALSWKNMKMKKIYINDIDEKALKSAKEHFWGLDRDDLKDRLEFVSSNRIPEVIKKCELLVNASPVGMKEGDPCVINRGLLNKNLSVYDVVYNRITELVKEAQAKGIAAVGGLGMLLYQGAVSFEFWTGRQAPIEVMREALNKGVEKL